MRGLRNIAFLSGILILCACGFAFLPEPTKKKVVKADLLGVWEYPADYGSTTVTIEFKPGYTFVQTITPPSPAAVQVHLYCQ